MEIDTKFVVILFQQVLYVYRPFTEHIVGFEDTRVVQIDVRIRVQSFEIQFNVVFIEDIRGYIQCRFIFPVFFVYPLNTPLIQTKKRVFDDLVIH